MERALQGGKQGEAVEKMMVVARDQQYRTLSRDMLRSEHDGLEATGRHPSGNQPHGSGNHRSCVIFGDGG
jgi:hypothetical protein